MRGPSNARHYTRMKIRLIAFIFATAAMVILIGWTGQSLWARDRRVNEKLTAVQLESFRIVIDLTSRPCKLNNLVPALRPVSRHQ